MSGLWNSKTQQYEVFSTLEGGMVPAGKPMEYRSRAGIDHCGYCKSSYDEQGNCNCNGHGDPVGSRGICGYCHDYIMEDGCSCDGFGGDKITGEKPCRWCAGTAVGHFCIDCGQAQ